jgi:hypothetical protein
VPIQKRNTQRQMAKTRRTYRGAGKGAPKPALSIVLARICGFDEQVYRTFKGLVENLECNTAVLWWSDWRRYCEEPKAW